MKIRVSEQKRFEGFGLVHELEIQVQCLPACHKLVVCHDSFARPVNSD